MMDVINGCDKERYVCFFSVLPGVVLYTAGVLQRRFYGSGIRKVALEPRHPIDIPLFPIVSTYRLYYVIHTGSSRYGYATEYKKYLE